MKSSSSNTLPYYNVQIFGSGYANINAGNYGIANTWQLLELVTQDPNNSNNVSLYVNGSIVASRTFTDMTVSQITQSLFINGRANTDFYSDQGLIAELIIFNRSLTDIERRNVEGMISSRYNLPNLVTNSGALNLLSSIVDTCIDYKNGISYIVGLKAGTSLYAIIQSTDTINWSFYQTYPATVTQVYNMEYVAESYGIYISTNEGIWTPFGVRQPSTNWKYFYFNFLM